MLFYSVLCELIVKMNKKSFGAEGEAAANKFLKQKGYKILETNFRNRFAEIDLIALEKDCLVFIEVKTRSSEESGLPLEAVSETKQHKIRTLASIYCDRHREFDNLDIRFDCIGIIKKEDKYIIEHIRDAF